ncbi:MAG: hypothetical protein ACWA5X_11420, partial [bacterium]
WTMDVTSLPSRVKGQFYYLYLVEYLYSRFGVHCEVFERANSVHICRVIEQAMWREKYVLAPPVLICDNDNGFIESLLRSLKCCRRWPSQDFESLEAAQRCVGDLRP